MYHMFESVAKIVRVPWLDACSMGERIYKILRVDATILLIHDGEVKAKGSE